MADPKTEQHRWLGRLVGEWTWEMEAEAEPGQPPITDSGSESVRSLGVWVIFEAGGTTPQGDDASSIMSIGYDPERGRFQGTFLSSMMTYLWIYEGTLDAAENVLTLNAEGPSYTEEGKMAKYRDTIELRGDDHRVHTSSYQRQDGGWHPFMTTHYRRAR
jgi:hypothetical protein